MRDVQRVRFRRVRRRGRRRLAGRAAYQHGRDELEHRRRRRPRRARRRGGSIPAADAEDRTLGGES